MMYAAQLDGHVNTNKYWRQFPFKFLEASVI